MPELPEVETVVRDLRTAGLVGRTIVRACVYWPRTVAGMPVEPFRRAVRGRRIEGIARRAKYIILELSGARDLLIHLRMTGGLSFADPAVPREKHEHVVLLLDDGRELRYRDSRKFGRWELVGDRGTRLAHLGPEPLSNELSAAGFAARVRHRQRMLKPLLLDQGFIAGLGNIYVDEALWDAGLHPCRRSDSISDVDARRLYRSIRKVLNRGVRSMGTTLGTGITNFYSVSGRRGRNKDGLKVFRRVGEPCPRCRSPIERLVVAQRSTHICPTCQSIARGGAE